MSAPSENTLSAPRQQWIDVVRGLGIILVVFGHVERGLTAAGLVREDSWLYPVDYITHTFNMPLFFVVAGLNAEHSLLRGAANFFWGKCWTVAYPYFLWSIIQGSVQVAMSGAINRPMTIHDLMAIPWIPISPFWFLYALFICHVLIAVTPRNRFWLAIVAGALYAFSFIESLGIVSTGCHYFLFYALGVFLAPYLEAWFQKHPPRLWALVVIVGLCLIATGIGYRSGFDYTSPLLLPAATLGIAGMIGLARFCSGRMAHVLGLLGMMSMAIFVMHILAAAGTRGLLLKLHVPVNLPLYLFLGTFVGVAAPVLAFLVFRRFGLLTVLGLVKWPRKK